MHTTLLSPEHLVSGTFLYEIKNRFLCMVRVASKDVVCYIPSSCRLSNFLELEGQRVLLKPVTSKDVKTQYSVFAVRFKRSYLILNTTISNAAIEKSILERRFSFLGKRTNVARERKVSDYKCDLFIQDTNTIIEIKSIISTECDASFPSVYSERANDQLHSILRLLNAGYKVVYLFVSLSPYVKQISISESQPFASLFRECVLHGMLTKCVTLRMRENGITIESMFDVK